MSKNEIIKNIFFLITLIIILFFLTIPFIKNIYTYHSQVRLENESLISRNSSGNSLKNVDKIYTDLSDKLPSQEDLLLKIGSELSLITRLEELAQENNLLQSLNLSQNNNDYSENIRSVNLNIELTGDFEDIVSYLNQLSKINFYLTVDSLNLKVSPEDKVIAKLLTNSYWLK